MLVTLIDEEDAIMSKSSGFIEGYEEAERQMYQIEDGTREWYANPFDPNDDAYRGFEEGFYDFTQK